MAHRQNAQQQHFKLEDEAFVFSSANSLHFVGLYIFNAQRPHTRTKKPYAEPTATIIFRQSRSLKTINLRLPEPKSDTSKYKHDFSATELNFYF